MTIPHGREPDDDDRDPPDPPDEGEESPEAHAADAVNAMPKLGELLCDELGDPVDIDAADLMGQFLTAVLSGLVDDHIAARGEFLATIEWEAAMLSETVYDRAPGARSQSRVEREALDTVLRSARLTLQGLLLALQGDPVAIRAQQTAAKAYESVRKSIEGLREVRRSRLVGMIERGVLATAARRGADSVEWEAVVTDLREIEPALKAATTAEEILEAWRDAVAPGNTAARTAARMSLALKMFRDAPKSKSKKDRRDVAEDVRRRRNRTSKKASGLKESWMAAITRLEKSFAKARKKYPDA